jgi:tripartite ATP-independent transporter DctM subunit
MILYTIITEASLGKLFIAGVVPGLLLVILMTGYILLRVALNPKLAPPGPAFSWKERFKSLVHLIPMVVIFVSVIGGLYMGVWSPTEAGATGSIAAFILCLAYRRVSWGTIRASTLNTVKTFVMIYMLLFGASLIAYLFFISGISGAIGSAAAALALPSWLIIVIIWLIMMILGCFLDPPAILLIVVPVFLPVVESLGFNIVWFGVIMVLAAEMAQLTPPVGIGLFIIKSIAPEGVTMVDCIMGSLPYVGILWILLLLLIFFPEIAMWLPGMMR